MIRLFRIVYICLIAILVFVLITSKNAHTDVLKEESNLSKIDLVLQAKIADWANKEKGDYSISVRELDKKERIANANVFTDMPLASTYKLFLAYATYHEVEEGNIKMSTKVKGGQTVKACVKKMIVYSDNPCGRDLGFLIGWDNAEKILQKAGVNNVKLNNYENDEMVSEKTGTSQAHSKLLQKLQSGKLISKAHAQDLLGYMEDQRWRERIPAGVPNDIKVADKPGFWLDTQNDAGIVYGPKSTYVLVILSNSGSPTKIAELSSMVYQYLQN